MNNKPHYMMVENRPIPCQFCGASVFGKVTEKKDHNSKETIKECRWICGRCGNLSKIGIVQ